jgi:hypothetical protein
VCEVEDRIDLDQNTMPQRTSVNMVGNLGFCKSRIFLGHLSDYQLSKKTVNHGAVCDFSRTVHALNGTTQDISTIVLYRDVQRSDLGSEDSLLTRLFMLSFSSSR